MENKFLGSSGLARFLEKLYSVFSEVGHTHSKKDITDFPTIPTKTSELTNDSGYKTTDNNTTYVLTKSGSTITLTGTDGSAMSVTDDDTKITVDSELSDTSENPVKNKVIKEHYDLLQERVDNIELGQMYKQNDEPTDAEDGSLWIDMDAEGTIGSSTSTSAGFVAQPEAPSDTSLLWLDTDDDSSDGMSGGNGSGADWNAAEGEPGHVLNRTHCKKVTTMLKNAVCASDGEVYTLPECGSLVVGNTYDITIDGTTYSLKAFELDGVPAIGSVEYIETFDPTLPVPLVFMEETPGVIQGVYGDMTAENITVTLITYSYETIPVEYLPKQYHVIPVSSDAWVKTNGAYNITDYDIRDLYSAYKAGYPVYIDIDYGEYGTKRIQITGYCFNWPDLSLQQGFEQNLYTLPVFLAGVWHNGLAAEIVTVRINVTD